MLFSQNIRYFAFSRLEIYDVFDNVSVQKLFPGIEIKKNYFYS